MCAGSLASLFYCFCFLGAPKRKCARASLVLSAALTARHAVIVIAVNISDTVNSNNGLLWMMESICSGSLKFIKKLCSKYMSRVLLPMNFKSEDAGLSVEKNDPCFLKRLNMIIIPHRDNNRPVIFCK